MHRVKIEILRVSSAVTPSNIRIFYAGTPARPAARRASAWSHFCDKFLFEMCHNFWPSRSVGAISAGRHAGARSPGATSAGPAAPRHYRHRFTSTTTAPTGGRPRYHTHQLPRLPPSPFANRAVRCDAPATHATKSEGGSGAICCTCARAKLPSCSGFKAATDFDDPLSS